jgi:hypothetical protein
MVVVVVIGLLPLTNYTLDHVWMLGYVELYSKIVSFKCQ